MHSVRSTLTPATLARALRTPSARPSLGLLQKRPYSTAPADIPPLHDLAEGGTVVCVTSGKGGVGKTTTSASLAMGLAERGFRVCAVDFDSNNFTLIGFFLCRTR